LQHHKHEMPFKKLEKLQTMLGFTFSVGDTTQTVYKEY
jgi:hypothetical protein